ncbi:SAM-dependent methyltransferase [Streptomyces megasporus]|uniref:SAM-dependent methyltransferase n=1 Tax=Streptomyces megasporus TaxID=44060 RepID=UPI001B803E34|nr:SAM-dependent methyltransferase [Streptomyces megasporus]
MTLEDLTTGENALLRPGDACQGSRAVDEVETADTRWRLPRGTKRLRDGLVVVPPPDRKVVDDPRPVLRTLVSQGAAALVVVDSEVGPRRSPAWATPGLLAVARSVGLPLLTPTRASTVPEVQARILRRQYETLRIVHEQTTRLLTEARRLDAAGEGPGPLLSWLSKATDSKITIISRQSQVWAGLAEHNQVLERLIAGRLHSATVEADGRHVRLHAIGATAPHQVLAAVRDTPWSRHAGELIDQAAGQVALLQQPLALRARERRLRQTEMAVKVSVLQYLMAGDVVQATRTAAPLLPSLGSTDACEVAVLRCAPGEERSAVVAACDEALGGRALVVMCPAVDTHVIMVHPRTDDHPEAARLLRPVVAADPQRAVGVSRPAPWTRVEPAYTAATEALVRAESLDERVWVADGSAPLAELLPPSARAWAAALLSPLDELPDTERQELCDTAHLALIFSPARAAKLLGKGEEEAEAVWMELTPATAKALGLDDLPHGRVHRSRNTISRKLSELMERVGLDRTQVAHRAVLDLALQLAALPAPPPDTAIPTLTEVLEEEAAREWAGRLLAPVDDPKKLGLLTMWAECNAALKEVAEVLGRHRNTVARGLAEVSAAISRHLTDPGRGQHDAWLALAIDPGGEGLLGMLPAFAVSPPGSGEPKVHGAHMCDELAGATICRDGTPDTRISGAPASTSGIYDALLGGKDNYTADQLAARELLTVWPTAPLCAQVNRAFVLRSARWLAEEVGIRQFLDLGCGMPDTRGNLHEVVQGVDPKARILYVDNDPKVLTRAQALMRGTDYLDADVTDPDRILSSPHLSATLDMDQPVAVYLCAVLHFLPDDQDPWGIVRRFTDALAPGSHVVISHATSDFAPEVLVQAREIYERYGLISTTTRARDMADIARLADGLELVAPGIVPPHRWHPEAPTDLPDDADINFYALIGCKK